MATYPKLRYCEFLGLGFPAVSVTIKGGVRAVKHEYPFAPGADIESLGRQPLEIQIESLFVDSLINYGNQLYPLTLGQLERAFEAEERGSLLVPGLGTIKALCVDWSRSMTGKVMNGEAVSMSFVEIVDKEFSTESLVTAQSTNFSDNVFKFQEYQGRITSEPSIFSQIQDLANQVQAILDTPELAHSLLSAKISQLTSIISRADSSLQELQNPENFDLSEVLRELWFATESLGKTVLRGAEMQLYTTPAEMTLQDLSVVLFGTPDRGSELLDINPIEDVFAIPANTPIKYLVESATD